MKISDLLTEDKISPFLKGTNKDEIIDELLGLIKEDASVENFDEVRKSVFDREKIMSTGIGKGAAIPHGKSSGVSGMVAAFGKTKEHIDFASLDNEPVNLFFLLAGRSDMVGPHIKLLSRISRLMNKDDFREKLSAAETSGEILKIFVEEEEKFIDLK